MPTERLPLSELQQLDRKAAEVEFDRATEGVNKALRRLRAAGAELLRLTKEA